MVIALQAQQPIAQYAEVAPGVIEAAMATTVAATAHLIHQAAAIAVATGQLEAAVQGHVGPEAVHPSITRQHKSSRSPPFVKQLKLKRLLNRIFEIAFFVTLGTTGKAQRKNSMIFSKRLVSKFGSVRKILVSAYQ